MCRMFIDAIDLLAAQCMSVADWTDAIDAAPGVTAIFARGVGGVFCLRSDHQPAVPGNRLAPHLYGALFTPGDGLIHRRYGYL